VVQPAEGAFGLVQRDDSGFELVGGQATPGGEEGGDGRGRRHGQCRRLVERLPGPLVIPQVGPGEPGPQQKVLQPAQVAGRLPQATQLPNRRQDPGC
jgi:hypothetical protein